MAVSMRAQLLEEYIHRVVDAYDNCKAMTLAQSLSLQNEHCNTDIIYADVVGAVKSKLIKPELLGDVIISHLLTARAMKDKDYMRAFTHQVSGTVDAVFLLRSEYHRRENWTVLFLCVIAVDLRVVAMKLWNPNGGVLNVSVVKTADDILMACYKMCATDTRAPVAISKRIGMVFMANQYIKTFFDLKKYDKCRPLMAEIEHHPDQKQFPLSDMITYKYYVGCLAIMDGKFKTAEENLLYGLHNTSRTQKDTRKMILTHLIPLRMMKSCMPKSRMLRRYSLTRIYENLGIAYKIGSVGAFNRAIDDNFEFFFDKGLHLFLTEQLRPNMYRNLFKRVYKTLRHSHIYVDVFTASLQAMGMENATDESSKHLITNLRDAGKIRCHIVTGEEVDLIILRRPHAFPRLRIPADP